MLMLYVVMLISFFIPSYLLNYNSYVFIARQDFRIIHMRHCLGSGGKVYHGFLCHTELHLGRPILRSY